MEQDPNTGRMDNAPEPQAPPSPYPHAWGRGDPAYLPGTMPGAMPNAPLPSSPYAPPSQPYVGYPGYPGYGWPANATAPSPYGYPSYPGYPGQPGYQAPAAPAPRRGMPVWAVVVIAVMGASVVVGCVFGALAAESYWRAGSLSGAVPPAGNATATAQASTIANGRTFTDSLNGAANTGWSTDTYCFFKDGAYHITPAPTYGSYTCFAPAGSFSDFDMQVRAQEVSGPLDYGYGMSFRRQSAHNFYVFEVAGNGEAWFGKYVNATFQRLSPFWPLRDFTQGLNTANTLRVTAQGSTFTFYVNGVQAGTVADTTYTNGLVGLYAGDTNLEAAFNNFSITGVS